MNIRILGTRGEIRTFHPEHVKHSGILIDQRIMLDIGEKAFLEYHPKLILITHLHPDHAFFMKDGSVTNLSLPVYAPERSPHLKNIIEISDHVRFENYKIRPIPVVHSTKFKSTGYLIERGNKRLLYTGDIAGIKRKYLNELPKLDLVITEASFMRRGGLIRRNAQGQMFGHNGVPDLVDLFKTFTGHIIFTHFGTWFVKDVPAGTRKIKSLQQEGLILDVAADGMEIQI